MTLVSIDVVFAMSQTVFIFNNFLAFSIAYLLSEIVFRIRPVWLRLFASVCSFSLVSVFVVVFLGLAGRLNALWAFVVLGVLFVVMIFVKVRRDRQFQGGIKDEVGTGPDVSRNKLLTYLGGIFLGILLGITISIVVVRGVKYNPDDLSYHATAAAHWFVDGRLSLAPVGSYHAYYPFNAEALCLWFLLPFGSDGLVGLVGFYWLCVFVFSVVGICIVARYRPAAIVFAVVISLSPEVVKSSWQNFSAVDMASAAMMLASSVMAIVALSTGSRKPRVAEALYSGLFLGFAIGCKVSFAPAFFVLLLWFLFSSRGIRNFRQRVLLSLTFIFGVCLTGTFWYMRNLIITGNPLFPAEFWFLDGPLSSSFLERTRLIWWFAGPGKGSENWLRIIQGLVSWPPGVFVLSAIGYFVTVVCMLRRKKMPGGVAGMVLISIGIVLILTHPMMPFSATDMASDAKLRIGQRFLIGPFVIGLVLFCQLFCGRPFRRFWYGVAALAIVVPIGIGVIGNCVMNAVWIVCGVMTILVLRKYSTFLRAMLNNKLFVTVFIFTVLLGSVMCFPYQQRLNDEKIFDYTVPDKHLGPAWQVLDSLDDGTKTTWFGKGSYRYYPLFGRRLQHRPVVVTAQGLPREHVHERWLRRKLSGKARVQSDEVIGLQELIANLKRCDVDCVFVSVDDAGNWPWHYEVLTSSSRISHIYNDGQAAILRID